MDSRGALRPKRVSFGNEHQSPSYAKGKLEPWTRAQKCLVTNEKPYWSSFGQSLEIPHNPIPPMEFLCRSWSPSSSNFLQIFSSSNLLMHSHENCSLGEHEVKLYDNLTSGEHEEEKMEETKGHATLSNRSTSSSKVDNIRKWLTLDKSVQPVVQTRKSFITSLFRRRVKTKEEDRLRTANVHAALSVTRLAAAIAGFAANSTKDKEEANKDVKHISSEGKVDWDQNMSNIVASAAALIATICAESAESIGANRGHVASAVNSGLATQTPADMMTLTATAATCGMRGAAMLKSRAMEYDNLARKLLEVEAQLPVVTPSGHKRHRRISIYSKHKQLILNLEKKYLGVLTTSKKYKIIHVKEEEAHGNFSISLKSNCGDIKLWFEDKNQSLLWISVISNLLQMHNSC